MVYTCSVDSYPELELAFEQKGFAVARNLIPRDLATSLLELSRQDHTLKTNAHAVLDASGLESRLTLWYAPGDDPFGRLSCCRELVSRMSALLGGRASFFHAKLMQKQPRVGGKWEWHQDYGYWYRDGFLSPDMGSCFVALEPATLENGCMQVIPGSHRYGRLDHGAAGGQLGADPKRVQSLAERLGVEACLLDAGDALFFHANLLHMSDANRSAHSRLGLITSFFREDNESIVDDDRYRNKRYSEYGLNEVRLGGALSEELPFLVRTS